ncbi:MAG: hypothetical protein ACOXZV_00580 [Bacteroidales bacterium]|jgi:hypothetical protein
MKTEKQIRKKIAEHEKCIDEILLLGRRNWKSSDVSTIKSHLLARTSLLWVLSQEEYITSDDYCTKVDKEVIDYYFTRE